MSNLDSFIHSSRQPPKPIATSQEIRDRSSTFIAHIYKAASLASAQACIRHLKNVEHGPKPASHEIAAWRFMGVREGRTGLDGEEDFELRSGSEDDGEEWAGGRVLKVMQNERVIDAVVVVSRWYGGIMLGPARFSHIETCAQEVCRAFKREEEFRECISSLFTLDDILADLRAELATLSSKPGETAGEETPPSLKKKPADYSTLSAEKDLPKAKRLVGAREKAIKNIKGLIAKQKEKEK